jgi:SAM-dependent methyltransferase
VWTIGPEPSKYAHYAAFPRELVMKALRGLTPERVCVECGVPWARVVELDWRPTCGCSADWQPGLVLDPFCGTGTTLVAAQEMGFRAVGIEYSPTYAAMAAERLEHVALPMRGL